MPLEGLSKKEIYERGEMLDNRVGFGDRPAVVAIDFQYGETDTQYPIGSDMSEQIETNNELVDLAHEKGIPVYWTRVVFKHPDAEDAGLWTKKLPVLSEWQEGTRQAEIDDRCHVREEDHILDKRHASSFHDTELDSMLNAQGVDTVLITGCSTSACVRETACDALANGFHSIVVADCVEDRSTEEHEAHLFTIDAKFGDVVSLEETREYLNSL